MATAAIRHPAIPGSEYPEVGRWFLPALALTYIGFNAAIWASLAILLPRELQLIVGPDGKEAAFAVLSVIGVLGSLICVPVVGILSDRTHGRWGRRRPWMAVSAVLTPVALLACAVQTTMPGLTVAWLSVQITANFAYICFLAAVADVVPAHRRARATGYLGAATTFGIILGAALASFVFATAQGAFVFLAGFFALSMVPLLLIWKEQSPSDVPGPFRWAQVFSSFVGSSRHPDLIAVWFVRALIILGGILFTSYLLYFLQDRGGLSLKDATSMEGVATGAYALLAMTVCVLAGLWSDRVGRRRVFVTAGAVLIAVAGWSLTIIPSASWVIVLAALMGVGNGIFLAVDQALNTLVLPDVGSTGRDLGIINGASVVPQLIAPPLSAFLVVTFGRQTWGYPILYTVAAAVTLAGGALVYRVRSVA